MTEAKKNDGMKNNEGFEIDDFQLELVAGGVYTYEEWKAMTTEERMEATNRSEYARSQGKYCELD